jgi:hypothetical protein
MRGPEPRATGTNGTGATLLLVPLAVHEPSGWGLVQPAVADPRRGVRGMTTEGRDRNRPSDEPPLVTSCGRRIEVRCLRLAGPARPIARVTLDVGPDQGDEHGVWAALTIDEARELAHRLLAHAAVADSPTDRPRTPQA